MSIGKKLLELRQRKGLSQEELASQLHVSRQTISKWESDLSLPDMRMMVIIAELYNVPITELLGIDEQLPDQESVARIYDQTSLVLENIQVDNKKRQKRDIAIILSICAMCMLLVIVSIGLFIRISQIQGDTFITREYVNGTETNDSLLTEFETNDESMVFDLSNKTIAVNFVCNLKEYNKGMKVKFVFTDTAKKEHQFEMVKENDRKFIYNGTIPLSDYTLLEVIIDQGEGSYKVENVLSGMDYLTNTITKMVHLQIPKTKDGHLEKNKVIFDMNFTNFYDEEKNNYKGMVNGKAHIKMSQNYKGQTAPYNDGSREILDTSFDIKQNASLELLKPISNKDEVYGEITITIDNTEIKVSFSKRVIENTYSLNQFELVDENSRGY